MYSYYISFSINLTFFSRPCDVTTRRCTISSAHLSLPAVLAFRFSLVLPVSLDLPLGLLHQPALGDLVVRSPQPVPGFRVYLEEKENNN